MTREIKFRAWHKDEKRMIYADEIEDRQGTLWAIGFHGLPIAVDADSFKDGNVTGWNIDHRLNLMQFTGLTDKNGKEIYEGDILKTKQPFDNYGDALSIVKYEEGTWNYSYNLQEHCERPDKDWEVLGNIYENPELARQYIYSTFLRSLDEAKISTMEPVEHVWMNLHTRALLTEATAFLREWRDGPVLTTIYGCEISIDERLPDGRFDFRRGIYD